jgi:enoyl-CoA hydratase/carnithine racemase
MPLISVEQLSSGVAHLRLSIGRGNPLTPEALEELESALRDLHSSPPRALVISSADPKIFSGGFALPVIASWNREDLSGFFASFLRSIQLLLRFPAPTICAVSGHAIAGGFILSLAADLRFVSQGRLKLGLSETQLGVSVPAGTLELLAARTSEQTALRMGLQALLIGPDEALRVGYAEELVEDAVESAVKRAEALAALPGEGASVTRSFRGDALADRIQTADDAHLDRFLDTWFSEVGQASIQAMAKKLSG